MPQTSSPSAPPDKRPPVGSMSQTQPVPGHQGACTHTTCRRSPSGAPPGVQTQRENKQDHPSQANSGQWPPLKSAPQTYTLGLFKEKNVPSVFSSGNSENCGE